LLQERPFSGQPIALSSSLQALPSLPAQCRPFLFRASGLPLTKQPGPVIIQKHQPSREMLLTMNPSHFTHPGTDAVMKAF